MRKKIQRVKFHRMKGENFEAWFLSKDEALDFAASHSDKSIQYSARELRGPITKEVVLHILNHWHKR